MFFKLYPENTIGHFLQIVCFQDNLHEKPSPVFDEDSLHEMSNPVFWEE